MASKRKNRLSNSENGTKVVVNSDGSEKFTCFYGPNAVLGNFFPLKFVISGVEFNCTEQYFHYKKAEHFGDKAAMNDIINADSPADQKKLGRQVQGYDEAEWNKVGLGYMKEGVFSKFEQNPELRKLLFQTIGTTLVEASPRDRKWGIGMGITNPDVGDRKAWKGKNLLGTVLMDVRDQLINDERFKNEIGLLQ